MLRLYFPVVYAGMLALGLACSNPDKPHLVQEEVVVTVEIKVTTRIIIDSLMPPAADIGRVELDIWRNGEGPAIEEFDFRKSDSKLIDPAHICGTNVSILAKAFTAAGDLVYFGYIERPYLSPDAACSLTVVLNWSLINARTAGLPDNYVFDVCMDNSGAIWAATHNGVVQYNGTRWKTYTTLHGLPSNEVNAVLCDQGNAIWAATAQGAARLDQTTGTWRAYRTGDGLVNNQVQCLLTDAAGAVWLGTAGGASRWVNDTWTNYPAAGNVAGLFQDALGRLWCGTFGTGLRILQDTVVTAYTMADGLPSPYVWSITQEGALIWTGTSLGAAAYDGMAWTAYDGDRFDPDVVYGVGVDRTAGQGIWFVSAWSIHRLIGTTWRQYRPVLDHLHLNHLYIDPQNHKWFTTSGHGIILYAGSE